MPCTVSLLEMRNGGVGFRDASPWACAAGAALCGDGYRIGEMGIAVLLREWFEMTAA